MTKARKALMESIEHWHQNLDMLILNHLSKNNDLNEDIRIGCDFCSLCKEYHTDYGCGACPIKSFTGLSWCSNTKYKLICDWYNNINLYDSYNCGFKAISDELELLYSILDITK
jgi:hypothetical protein